MIYDLSNIDQSHDFVSYFTELIKKKVVVELTEKKKKRTIKQNSYLHVIITLLAIELGYTLEETKTVLKRKCHFMIYDKEGMKFLKRTRDLNTKELTEFIEWIRNYAGAAGIYLPTSEEYLIDQTRYNREINTNKQYL